jgi:hypothetical protein
MIRETIEKLLAGEFICQITYPNCYADLKDPENRPKIDSALAILNRYVATTANETVFYAAWKNVEDYEKNKITSEYNQLRNQLRPIVEFILLVMDANLRDNPIMSGERISEADLNSRIEGNVTLTERAANIMLIINQRKSSEPLAQQIKTMLDIMQKMGVIIENTKDSRIFTTTGKIEYIYEILTFIDSHEHILTPEIAHIEIQEDLFDEV